MRFGAIAVAGAVGAILVHTTRAGERVLKKGRVLSADDVAALDRAGVREVICAQLDDGELDEDAAAAQLALALGGDHVRVEHTRTGRSNLHATADGVVVLDTGAIAAANAVDEAITIATVPAFAAVRAGELVATVKIIPFAARVDAVEAAVAAVAGAVQVRAWRGARAGLVLTRFADTAASILDRAAAAQRTRVERCGGRLVDEVRVAHDVDALATAIAAQHAAGLDPILVLGASAIMDRRDVIPAALTLAGGAIVRLGMPVDPGNLLMLGALGAATVIGVPGCARSLKRSGYDWVLERTCAGLAISAAEIAALGVGGLLDEIQVRPTPRAVSARAPQVAAVVLAAGRASRMGRNKLVAELDGEPIVRRAVRAALASSARPVVVVTGHEAALVRAALAELDVTIVHNPDHASGMSTSLRVGVAAIEALPAVDAAVICLGDMPRVIAAHLDAVIAAARDAGDSAIVVPTCERKRGNPVLWPRRYFAEIGALTGDVGARALIERHADDVHLVAIDDPAILLDVDTPAALAALQERHDDEARR